MDDLEYHQYRKLEAMVKDIQESKGGSLSYEDSYSLLLGVLADIRARLIRLEKKTDSEEK
jgi:hypothetical protein